MQATIYVTNEAMATAIAIKDLDYYTRVSLSDSEATDLTGAPGYYLKNADHIRLAELPATAHVAIQLTANADHQPCEVSIPTTLRGCIFANAPNIPDQYAEIVTYWSGVPLNADDSRAVHFQNPQNEYMVQLLPTEDVGIYKSADRLLSEGIVISIRGVVALIEDAHADEFVEIHLPIDADMLGVEPDAFQSTASYRLDTKRQEKIFLKIADIRQSPNPDHIMIDILRQELLDYGYWY